MPVQVSLRELRGECSSTDISVHCGIAVALRNSMPFLRMRTALVGRSNVEGNWPVVVRLKIPEVSSFPALMVLLCDQGITDSRWVNFGFVHHSITAAPQVRPAPNATSRIKSPRCTRPEWTTSSNAMATEAAEVLPYLWRLMNTCSGVTPRRAPPPSVD